MNISRHLTEAEWQWMYFTGPYSCLFPPDKPLVALTDFTWQAIRHAFIYQFGWDPETGVGVDPYRPGNNAEVVNAFAAWLHTLEETPEP